MRTRGNDLSLVFANTARNKIMTPLTTKQLTNAFQVQNPRLRTTSLWTERKFYLQSHRLHNLSGNLRHHLPRSILGAFCAPCRSAQRPEPVTHLRRSPRIVLGHLFSTHRFRAVKLLTSPCFCLSVVNTTMELNTQGAELEDRQ